MPTLTYLQAIRQAIAEEIERDPRVFLIGEDIGQYGGVFKLTNGFIDQFGPERIIDTPITEAGIIGAAAGAAMMGLRPIVEMQFIDFLSCGFNQLTNLVAKFFYRTAQSLPLVVRGPSGGGVGAGPFHSQNPESYFIHTPGLKIVAPSTPADAKGLLKAAIRDEDPVLYLEFKSLYRQSKQDVPEADGIVPIGRAETRKEGTDITLITYGPIVHKSLEASNRLELSHDISVEVIDLRTLVPIDDDAIIASVRKTAKVMVVHEATHTGGIAGEIIARINESTFEYLDGPIIRVTAEDTPVPYSPPLEEAFLPQVDDIVAAACWLAKY